MAEGLDWKVLEGAARRTLCAPTRRVALASRRIDPFVKTAKAPAAIVHGRGTACYGFSSS